MLVCFDGLLSFSVVRAGGECFLFLFFWFLAKKKKDNITKYKKYLEK